MEFPIDEYELGQIDKDDWQIDLNNETNLENLEDPMLRAHMDQAREHLFEQENTPSPVNDEAIMQDDIEIRRKLSELITKLRDHHMSLRIVCDGVILQSTNAKRLANGDRPHGYPQTDCIEFLSKKISDVGDELSQVLKTLEEFERDFTIMRREYENIINKLLFHPRSENLN